MITLGSAALDQFAKNAGAAFATDFNAQVRLVAYVGTPAELTASQAGAPGAAIIAPYSAFLEVVYDTVDPNYAVAVNVHLPIDVNGAFDSLVPVAWSPALPADPAVTADVLNGIITGNNISAAYYRLARGRLIDRSAVPTADGAMFYAWDTKELYAYYGGWNLVASEPPAAVIGLMSGWSEYLPVPSAKFLRCDGTLVQASLYPDLLGVFQSASGGQSPFEDPLNPAGPGQFRLPLENNMIIRALP